jgi:pimeloyl-ACP methyl ester carboxylesterase
MLRAMLQRFFAAALVFAALQSSQALAQARPAAAAAPLKLTDCRIEHPLRVLAIDAQCGRLTVPENYDEPAGRKIELFVARVSAISKRKVLDPVFVIAGGPGQASTSFYASVAQAFGRVRRERDILLVDQRGTGGSRPLDCEFDETELSEVTPERIESLANDCRKKLSEVADLKQYTTSVAVRDLDAVRAALGYPRVSLYGVSYGTRVAQHYAKRFPNNTRALILDGVVHPGLVLGPAMALDAEAALERILGRCAAEKSCRDAFGDPVEQYRALRKTLEAMPVSVSLPDPTTGANKSFEFGRIHLSAVLRLASYSSDQAALLPLSLSLANRDGNFRPLAGQFLMIARSLGQTFHYGMHNSVVCSEDVPLIKPESIPRTQLAATHMGEAQVDQLVRICKSWPRGVVDTDFHAPLKSAAPAFLLSGSDDPVTPPIYATEAQKAFADSAHLVVPGFGHGQVATPCVDKLLEKFLTSGTAKGLDLSCTAKLKPTPFFVTPAGPQP